jgi:hypothetical protein
MRKRTLVQAVSVIAVMMLSSCTASLPKKENIVTLTNEQAANALKGKTEKEINENWGEPDRQLSGFYGDIYDYNDRQIVIYYNDDSIVTDVRILDQQN